MSNRLALYRLRWAVSKPRLWWNAWRDARQPSSSIANVVQLPTERLIVTTIGRMLSLCLAGLARDAEHAHAALQRAGEDVQHAEGEFARLHGTGDGQRRTSDRVLPPALRWSVFAIIVGAEVWYNAGAFQSLGEIVVAAWGLAVAVGIGLPVLADAFGVQVRHGRWTDRRLGGWAVLLVVATATMLVTTELRVRAAHDDASISGGVAPTSAMVMPDAPATVPAMDAGRVNVPSAHAPSDGLLRVVFFAMSVFLFVVAATVAALATDSRPGFADAQRGYAKARARQSAALAAVTHVRGEQTAVRESLVGLARTRIDYYRLVYRRWGRTVPAYFDDPNHPAHDPTRALLTDLARDVGTAAFPPEAGSGAVGYLPQQEAL